MKSRGKNSELMCASPNTVYHYARVTRQQRNQKNGHKSLVLWFTGLSGSGKSTLAHFVEEKLYQLGCNTIVLDGDNIRHGLCGDLGFGSDDRRENLRRIGEVNKLFVEAGVVVLNAFISPFREDREKIKEIFPCGSFYEIYMDCSIESCEAKDVKGLYKRVRAGEIKEFTGVDSPYEIPENPALSICSDVQSVEESVELVMQLLAKEHLIAGIDVEGKK